MSGKQKYISIPVKEDTYWELQKVRSELEYKLRRDLTWDEFIKILLERYAGEEHGEAE